MNNIINRIKKIIKNQFKEKKTNISLNSEFKKDLQADSLDFIELIMLLEEELKIELFDMETEKIKSVQDLITFIMQKFNKKK
ncbi:Acyl carrier protein [Buchnera aphidicola (Cinara kochiana kochiana)]|uniref:Acyl carrier protein n=1 Tax=Buchnera aphidicola (Cinara kochiana kochiana) TaxID=2518976 RepID=A0A451D5S1_9GAMM|nr:acyl carrier protein [Buchnera aphidicola]VFP81137.1 Acyl carrier protein [Buchnera aphidicola (Cinara kochiana kochiana)]